MRSIAGNIDAEHLKNLGNAQKATGDLEAAARSYQRSLAIAPDYLPARYNLGLVLRELNRFEAAEQQFRRVSEADPSDVDALFNLAWVLAALSRFTEAVRTYESALSISPRDPGLWISLGDTYGRMSDPEAALRCYRKVLELQPDNEDAAARLLFQMQHVCDWSNFGELCDQQRRRVAADPERFIDPFTLLSIPSTPEEQLRCASNYAKRRARAAARDAGSLHFRFEPRKKSRLRIGYLSADFREHATAYLMAELVELHDRKHFEIVAYSYGPDDGSAMRARLARTFDRFVDIVHLSHADAATQIHGDDVDILVDLKGYTQLARTEIVALRPAPIQVNYLGYPGTMGAGYIDYLVSDRFVTPPDHAAHFSEMLACVPGSYQVNSRGRPRPSTPPRSELGLPVESFVFCCLNQTYKILPEVFSLWMRLLEALPDSVLWLLESNPSAARHLRREARERGVAPQRLIFAPPCAADLHVARLGAADLFLDTFPYNAHTTGSDALWMGLPVLTCSGHTFASRVAGSLLSAIGLPELIAGSLDHYERLALELAREKGKLAALRARLARNRLTTPLFDTPAFARNLEAAYWKMWDCYLSGDGPCALQI